MTQGRAPGASTAEEGSAPRAETFAPAARARHPALLGALAAVLFLALRLAAVGTEAINWDELGYFARAAETLRLKALQTGGRPGLGAIFALPLVRGCADEVAVVHRARVIWTAIVALSAVALWHLVRQLLGGQRWARTAATAAVALWCLVPLFQSWSLQVRTDQAALLCALAAGCALLASRTRVAWAFAGGLVAGAGYLFSQKALYTLALVGLLTAGDRLLRHEWRPWGDALRAGLFALGGLAAVRGFGLVVSRYFGPPPTFTLAQGVAQLDFYRARVGFGVYRGVLPTLVPHLVLAALLAILTVRVLARRGGDWRPLALAWSALGLGVAVARFHTGGFAYFWITVGLFPAVGLALALPAILERWSAKRAARLLLAAAAVVLVGQGLLAGVRLLADTQRVQRESLWFVQRNFPPEQFGFHLDRAPFCRPDATAFPHYISEQVIREFGGPERAANVERFLTRFRAKRVHFLLDSYRMGAFPRDIRRFWQSHFLPYYQAVSVPGFALDPAAGAAARFEVLLAGAYRLERLAPGVGTVRLQGRELASGESIELAEGWHEADLSALSAPVALVWRLDEAPSEPDRRFYPDAMIQEIKWGTSRR